MFADMPRRRCEMNLSLKVVTAIEIRNQKDIAKLNIYRKRS